MLFDVDCTLLRFTASKPSSGDTSYLPGLSHKLLKQTAEDLPEDRGSRLLAVTA